MTTEEKEKTRRRKYYQKNKAKYHERYMANRERLIKMIRAKQDERAEQFEEYGRQYREKNREWIRQKARARYRKMMKRLRALEKMKAKTEYQRIQLGTWQSKGKQQ